VATQGARRDQSPAWWNGANCTRSDRAL
jgi:hypothetical protein